MYIIVVGGGKVGYYLTKTLLAEDHEVLLIEKDRLRAASLEREFGEVVVRGDGCEMRTLDEIGTGRADVVIAVTGDDEDNLITCQLSKKKYNVPRVIARVNNPKNEEIFVMLGIDATVSSTKIIYNLVEQAVEAADVIPVAALKRGNIELVEADLRSGSPVIGKSLSTLHLPQDALIISIIRSENVILPTLNTTLQENDTVLLLVKTEIESSVRQIFHSDGK